MELSALFLLLSFTTLKSALPERQFGCHFPHFLQSSDEGGGNWTLSYGVFSHNVVVDGGDIRIYTKKDYEEDEEVMKETRRCVSQHGETTFLVMHVLTVPPRYQCIEFVVRSYSVVQLALSETRENRSRLCNGKLHLDPFPWISLKHYKHSRVTCPFSGGVNFHKVVFRTKDHDETNLKCNRMTPSIRLESECVHHEGILLHFRDRECVPYQMEMHEGKKKIVQRMGLDEHLICMAVWREEGDSFALLRKANYDRWFYCMRFTFDKNLDIMEVVLFVDWVCHRRSYHSSQKLKFSILSSFYVTFSQPEKRMVTHPCEDEASTCSRLNRRDCTTYHCMDSCMMCNTNDTTDCTLPAELHGAWQQTEAYQKNTVFKIDNASMHHPKLGDLKCISFQPERRSILRTVLWSPYQNGCYPRMTCIHYDVPTESVLRYRVGKVIKWPYALDNDEICSVDNFLLPRDIHKPKDPILERPWEIALKQESLHNRVMCIFPQFLPEITAFKDNQHRRGCISLSSQYSPFTISIMYTSDATDQEPKEYHHECIAVLTYVNSFKSVLSFTKEQRNETLCWMVVESKVLVVVKTSSCNKETALGILNGDMRYSHHLKWILYLDTIESKEARSCQKRFAKKAERRLEKLEKLVEEAEKNISQRNCGFNSLFVTTCAIFLCIFV